MSQADLTGTPSDYTNDLYRVYFEIGDHESFGGGVIERFLATRGRDIPTLSLHSGSLHRVPYGYELNIPMQLIPEIVRELSRENVAVYQVVRLAKA